MRYHLTVTEFKDRASEDALGVLRPWIDAQRPAYLDRSPAFVNVAVQSGQQLILGQLPLGLPWCRVRPANRDHLVPAVQVDAPPVGKFDGLRRLDDVIDF